MQDIKPDSLQYVLLDLPGLLFFTTYTLLVLFWAEIYHQVTTVLYYFMYIVVQLHVMIFLAELKFTQLLLECTWMGNKLEYLLVS